MILKLTDIIITSTHLGHVWATVVPTVDATSGGLFHTGGFLITAFDTTGRVWISCLQPDAFGEGMETTAAKLADHLRARLFSDGAVAEIARDDLNTVVADFYREEF